MFSEKQKGSVLNVLIMGGQQNTGNLGVSALGTSCVDWLRQTLPGVDCTLQGGSERSVNLHLPGGVIPIPSIMIHHSNQLKARYGTRFLGLAYRSTDWIPPNVRRKFRFPNYALDRLLACDVVMDVSGGDSFSEIYGTERFETKCQLKEFALSLPKPLVLLPQTYGPFKTGAGRQRVRRIISSSVLIATRDQNGLEELEEIMGEPLDERFVECPDMAFGLQPVPTGLEQEPFIADLNAGDQLIGLNISELLFHETESFGLGGDYRELTSRIVEWAMRQEQSKLLLVPHVFPYRQTNGALSVSDREVCQEVYERYAHQFPGRIAVLQGDYGPAQIKYIIGKCGFFIGARMHACIAALSQGIPTAMLAYSKKARGVLGLAGIPQFVVELRGIENSQVVAEVEQLYRDRHSAHAPLEKRVSAARERIRAFFSDSLKPALEATCRQKS